MKKIKLSIIIPYHNTYELTRKLLSVLVPQLTEEVEVIIINDCDDIDFNSSDMRTIFIESNGTASKPRNIGLDNAKGKYIAFIDSDDLISEDYIAKILNKIKASDFDYCFFSWQFNGLHNDKVIITDNPPSWNLSVWNCIYKRETIGNERFNTSMKTAEDYDFNIRVRKGKKENIKDILYFYNDNRKDSLMCNALNKK